MARLVKCLYCGEQFNRDDPQIEWVKPNERRYAHKTCADQRSIEQTQEEKDQLELYKYISQLFGSGYDYPRTKRMVEKYKKEYDYTYSGMMKSLKWFYEIKGNNIEKANNSIGIIPYIYNDALQYYYNIYLAQQRANAVRENYKVPIQEVKIKRPQGYTPPPRFFDLGDTGGTLL